MSKEDIKEHNEELKEKYQDVLDYRDKLMEKYNLKKVESEDYEDSMFYKLKRADD